MRSAYEAYGRGDVTGLLELVHPDLEWTYLDPGFENPQPQVCHGRDQLAPALGRQADRGVNSELEEIASCGDRVMVAVHTPRRRPAPRLAVQRPELPGTHAAPGQVVAMRAFRDPDEARSFPSEAARGDEASILHVPDFPAAEPG